MALIETTDTPEDLERLLSNARGKLEAFEAAVDGKRLMARVKRASPAHPVLVGRGLFLGLGILFLIGMFMVMAAGMFHASSANFLHDFDRNMGVSGGLPVICLVLSLCMFVAHVMLSMAAQYIGRESPMLPWEAKEHQKLVNEVTRLTTQKAVMERIQATPGNARPRISTPVPMSMRGSQGGGGFGGLANRANSRPSYLEDNQPSYTAPQQSGGFGAPGRAPTTPSPERGFASEGAGVPPPSTGGSLLNRARAGRPSASPSFGQPQQPAPDYGNDFGGAPSSGGSGMQPYGHTSNPGVFAPSSAPDRPTFAQPDRPAFGQPDRPAFSQPDRPAFSQPDRPAFSQPDRPAFSQPTFGQSSAGTNGFGGPSDPSPFGQPDRGFGAPKASHSEPPAFGSSPSFGSGFAAPPALGAPTRGGTPLGAPPRAGVSLRQPSLTEPRFGSTPAAFGAASTPSFGASTPSFGAATPSDPGGFDLIEDDLDDFADEPTAKLGIQMLVKKTAVPDTHADVTAGIADIVEKQAAKIVLNEPVEPPRGDNLPNWGRIDEMWLEEAIQKAEEMVMAFPKQARLAFSIEEDLPFTLVIERATPAMAVRAMVSFVEFLAAIYTPKFARIQLIKVAHLDRSFHRNVDAALQPYFAGKVRVENNPGQIDILFSDPDPGWDDYPVLPME